MKNSAKISALLLVSAVLLSCNNSKPAAPVFVTDEYGVVEKINPQNKEVYLVFTGHYTSIWKREKSTWPITSPSSFTIIRSSSGR